MSENKVCRNRCQFRGRLVADAKLEDLGVNRNGIFFSIAVQNDYKLNGEWRKETLFLDCSAFGETNEKLFPSLLKGREVVVYGKLKMSRYFSKKYNHDVTKFYLLVGAIDVLMFNSQTEDGKAIEQNFMNPD